RVLEQQRDRSGHPEIGHGHGGAVVGEADHDGADAALEVGQVGGQAQDGHDLGGDHDVEAVLTRGALGGAAQTDHGLAQGAVVDVHHALPLDAARVQTQLVALMEMVVDQGGESVVGDLDRMEVAGEVEVDVLHRDQLGVAAVGGGARGGQDGAQGRLAQGGHGAMPGGGEGVGQAHGGGRLALPGGGGGHGGDQDELRAGAGLDHPAHADLGLVGAARDKV